ncbi:MAG: protoporphyrinogen oxidase HemJ [Acidobacteriota bacterium]|nr:protoporphyrinogen oxidase HemJ [Acidobacteriota bacterium]
MTYLVIKALHFIFMVAWFAGLFYMFRLFVYHTENKDNPDITKLFKVMEGRLYKIITVPAMVLTFVFGIIMIVMNMSLMQQGWMHIKLLLVVLLAGYTGFLGKTRRRYANDDVFLTSKQCRLLNEVPTVFLIAIVFTAVVFRMYLS